MDVSSDGRILGGIAIVSLVGAFAIVGLYVWQGKEPNTAVMVLITTVVSSVIGYFFGKRGVESGVEKATNGMIVAAAKITEAKENTAAKINSTGG